MLPFARVLGFVTCLPLNVKAFNKKNSNVSCSTPSDRNIHFFHLALFVYFKIV